MLLTRIENLYLYGWFVSLHKILRNNGRPALLGPSYQDHQGAGPVGSRLRKWETSSLGLINKESKCRFQRTQISEYFDLIFSSVHSREIQTFKLTPIKCLLLNVLEILIHFIMLHYHSNITDPVRYCLKWGVCVCVCWGCASKTRQYTNSWEVNNIRPGDYIEKNLQMEKL